MLVHLIDLFGVAVFAVSGALEAGRARLDLFGVLVIAVVTAIGGGTLRDVLLARQPIFWMTDPAYLVVITVAALATVALARPLRLARRALLLADAFGLAFFCVSGARVAERAGASAVVAVILGTMTGVAGGVVRDVLCGEVPLILRRDIYATAAIAGCAVFALGGALGVHDVARALAGMATAFGLRLAGIIWGLRLPVFATDPEEG